MERHTPIVNDQSSSSGDTTAEEITDRELLDIAIFDALLDLHVGLPVTVNAYDKTKQTVDVTFMIARAIPDGQDGFIIETLPDRKDVPVAFQRCNKFGLYLPLAKGDTGFCIFAERNIGAWRASGAQGDPGDIGTHTLDGAVFFPGLTPDGSVSQAADSTNMRIGSETDLDSRIEIAPTGGGGLGQGSTLGIARRTDLTAADTTMATWIAAVSTFINGLTPGSVVPPTDFGKISTASGKWFSA